VKSESYFTGGYNRKGKVISLADLGVTTSLEYNRSLKMMNKINKIISWKNIEALLLEYYDVEKSSEGADAHSYHCGRQGCDDSTR